MFTNSTQTNRQILSVTKLNRLTKMLLETEIGTIWLSAEISNFVRASSGHWYFSLKDNKAQIKGAMFKNANFKVRFQPKEGDKVLVRASVSLYEPRGDYQIIVEHMEPDGEGQLKQAFEALKHKLHREGLFDTALKSPLPKTIKKVGVITSSSGAALHDVLTVMHRRSPHIDVLVYPSMVQGDTAAPTLIHAIETANRRNEVDVLLLTRGGGSIEDLWAFNDEQLARAIRQSDIPIVSAVGHEIDVTIADYVADLRAATPSAAAELVSQDKQVLLASTQQLVQRLHRAFDSHNQRHHVTLQHLQQRLQSVHPESRIQAQQQTLDYLSNSLSSAFARQMTQQVRRLDSAKAALKHLQPSHRIGAHLTKVDALTNQLVNLMEHNLGARGQKLGYLAELLNSVSPLATLSRGYSITFKDSQPINAETKLAEGDVIETKLDKMQIKSAILSIE